MPIDLSTELQSIQHQKRLLRRQIRARCHKLSLAEQNQASQEIIQRLLTSAIFRRSRSIAAFMSLPHEVEIHDLIAQIWQHGKQCYLPVLHPIKPRRLWFARYTPQTRLTPNRFGILEPDLANNRILRPQYIDLVITPFVGFTNRCQRLGMGGGFYDTTFGPVRQRHSRKPVLIGLGFEIQKIATLPHQPWDLVLDAVITEVQQYGVSDQ